ncbi:MAG: domain S-box protein [Mucilaginibacter sp.]|nr:domain S-box protein [Mucilaginibacter sp.]
MVQEVTLSENQYHSGFYMMRDIGKEVFSSLESERGEVAELLQEDIVQLISIAKMKLSGDTVIEVNNYLTMAINKLRLLTFELKPQILEQFGLATALQTLLNQRLNIQVDHCQVNLHQLPLGIDKLMEIVIFRMVQQILNNVPFTYYKDFKLEIIRTGHYISLNTSFKTDTLIDSDIKTSITKDKLIKALQPNMYLFNGHYHFHVFHDGTMQLSVFLDESN